MPGAMTSRQHSKWVVGTDEGHILYCVSQKQCSRELVRPRVVAVTDDGCFQVVALQLFGFLKAPSQVNKAPTPYSEQTDPKPTT